MEKQGNPLIYANNNNPLIALVPTQDAPEFNKNDPRVQCELIWSARRKLNNERKRHAAEIAQDDVRAYKRFCFEVQMLDAPKIDARQQLRDDIAANGAAQQLKKQVALGQSFVSLKHRCFGVISTGERCMETKRLRPVQGMSTEYDNNDKIPFCKKHANLLNARPNMRVEQFQLINGGIAAYHDHVDELTVESLDSAPRGAPAPSSAPALQIPSAPLLDLEASEAATEEDLLSQEDAMDIDQEEDEKFAYMQQSLKEIGADLKEEPISPTTSQVDRMLNELDVDDDPQ